MTQSKIGYQVHNQMTYSRGWSAEEASYFWQHLERLNPAVMLFLDDEGKAAECKRRLPSCAVVVRSWTGDEGELHLKHSPQTIFDKYKHTPGDLIRNIGNEPSGYDNLPKLAAWYAEIMDLFGKAGLSIVVPNFGEGHPHETQLHELEPLWAALDKWHDVHYYGCHEYGTHRGMLFNEGGNHDVYPWRVGRFEMLTLPYLTDKGHKTPRVIVTEWGVDDAHDASGKRGWRDSMSEARYVQELKAAIDKIYHEPHYAGMCLFSYGNSGQQGKPEDWVSFDVSAAKTLHAKIEKLNPVTPPPPPQPPTPPEVIRIPEHPGLPVTGANHFQLAILVRGKPNGAVIGSIATKAQYLHYPATDTLATDDSGAAFVWRFVEAGDLRGWSRLDALGLDTPTPPVEPPPDNSEAWAALAARVDALEVKYDRMIEAINAAFASFTKRMED